MGYLIKSVDGQTVEAEIEVPSRERLNWIRLYLHHPEGKPLQSVRLNGVDINPAANDLIEIKDPHGSLRLIAKF